MTDREEIIRDAIARYIEQKEIGGEPVALNDLPSDIREEVESAIEILSLTDGAAIEVEAAREGPENPSISKESTSTGDAEFVSAAAVAIRKAMPTARVIPDDDVSDFSTTDLPLVGGWIVGTFGGRLRVWLVAVPTMGDLDGHPLVRKVVRRALRGLLDSAGIALAGRDLSCLLLEPSDCAPAIEVPAGTAPRYMRPVQQLSEAVASFFVGLNPSWDAMPTFDVPFDSTDVSALAAQVAARAVDEQKAIGQRAHFPKKEALATLGKREVDGLAGLIWDMYEGRLDPENVPERLGDLAVDR
ncbi:MAG: hypothetical protein WD004_00270 [Actinomycetota bacterium]